ncbi:hypothetical protein ALC56_01238 [Trachymyrmex septentrionalis]|uniref:CCHC-type domain-containing protein n=1 Tax=Trachymyrmex septentrionalis TaxID=34720 RepID=A0A151K0T6_9HYME|nr:hypothetical protein ALC56_01238 [Trachymyrmex septentrionalis]
MCFSCLRFGHISSGCKSVACCTKCDQNRHSKLEYPRHQLDYFLKTNFVGSSLFDLIDSCLNPDSVYTFLPHPTKVPSISNLVFSSPKLFSICNVARICTLRIYDKNSYIECELIVYAVDNIVYNVLHEK